MLSSLNKNACVKLTAEQIVAIKQQTGLEDVPDTVIFSVDIFVEGKTLHGSLSRGQDNEHGLIHEINRT